MCQLDALRQACGPARIRKRDDCVLVHLHVRDLAAGKSKLGERRQPLGLAEYEHFLDRRLARRLLTQLGERRHGQKELGSGIVELERELVGLVEGVRRCARTAEAGHRVVDDRVLRQVGKEESEHVALPEPARMQTRRDRVDRPGQLWIGDRPARWPVDERRLVTDSRSGLQDELVEGDLGNGYVSEWALDDHRSPPCSTDLSLICRGGPNLLGHLD